MDLDMEELQMYLDKYPTLSIDLIRKVRSLLSDVNNLDWKLRDLHENRKSVLEHGRYHIESGSLVHIISIHVKPNNLVDGALSVYGSIYAKYRDSIRGHTVTHDLFRRDDGDAEYVGVSGGTLTLTGPVELCPPAEAYIPMYRSVIHAELFDGRTRNTLASKWFSLDDYDDDYDNGTTQEDAYEQVKSIVIPCDQVSITIHYVDIPFGVFGRINVTLYSKKERDFVNVNGRITARYVNTFANYNSEESILFMKQATEYVRVVTHPVKSMVISRCWVGIPAYSSLILDLDLSEHETGQRVIKYSVHLPANSDSMYGGSAASDDFLVRVSVSWFSPTLLCPRDKGFNFRHAKVDEMDTDEDEDDDEMDIDEGDGEDDKSSEEEHDDESSPDWALRSHKDKLWPSKAVEIFSVFIFKKHLELEATVQIYGSIEISSRSRICYVMSRDEKNPLRLILSGNMKYIPIPIPDGSRGFEDTAVFEMKFDMKDVNDHLAIKGYVKWNRMALEYDLNLDKQLCSVIQGPNGFAAVHYSVFEEAVQANIKVSVNLKKESITMSKVYGSLTTEYDMYDYSTPYHKEFYRIALFKRNEDDAVECNADGSIPLSRSLVVVPWGCSLIVNVDLLCGVSAQRLLCSAKEIAIGEGLKTIETDDCIMHIQVDWCDIK